MESSRGAEPPPRTPEHAVPVDGPSRRSPARVEDAHRRRTREDRWEWRRRIRADPRKHLVYRWFVGVVGVLLLLVAGATGWLPGPGGIPLALLGLAVLASEFEWAQRLRDWAKDKARDLGRWSARQPPWVRVLGGVVTVACVVTAMWVTLRLFGVPGWAPDGVSSFLTGLPGL